MHTIFRYAGYCLGLSMIAALAICNVGITSAQDRDAEDSAIGRAKKRSALQASQEAAIKNAFKDSWAVSVDGDRVLFHFTVEGSISIPECRSLQQSFVLSAVPASARSVIVGNTTFSLEGAGGSEESPIPLSWIREVLKLEKDDQQRALLVQVWVGPKDSECRYLVGQRMLSVKW